MPTRLYFGNAAPAFTPTVQGTWDVQNTSKVGVLSKTKQGTMTSGSVSFTSTTIGSPYGLCIRLVSDALPFSKILRGTVKACFGAQGSTAYKFDHKLHLWVSQGNTSSVRGILLNDLYWLDDYNAWPTTAGGLGRLQPITSGWEAGWPFDSPVDAQAGDRIIAELGYYVPGGGEFGDPATGTGTLWYGGTNSTDLYQDAAAQTFTGWLEFSEDPYVSGGSRGHQMML
jgi:hypothetical protein